MAGSAIDEMTDHKNDESPRADRKKWTRRSWIAAYVLMVFLVLEIGLRVFYLYAIDDLEARYGAGGPITLSRMRFLYNSLRGVDLFTDGLVVYDQSRGYKLAPNLRGYAIGPEPPNFLNTNSEGFRGVAEYAALPPAGVSRIVAIGDSFTFGESVNDHDTWPAQLEGLLSDTEVLNLGVFAYSHDQATLALRDDGLRYSPDIVILGFLEADLSRNLTPFFGYAKAVPDPHGPEPFVGVPVDTVDDIRRRLWTRSFIVETILMAWEGVTYELPPIPLQEESGVFLINMMGSLAEEAGARFIVVNTPGYNQTESFPEEFILKYVRDEDVEFVDPRPAFKEVLELEGQEAYDALYLPEDVHPSAAGYKLIAEATARYLQAHPSSPQAKAVEKIKP